MCHFSSTAVKSSAWRDWWAPGGRRSPSCCSGGEGRTAARFASRVNRSRVRSPRHAIRHGIGLIPEDRKTDGLVLEMSVFDNATLSILKRHSVCGIVQRKRLVQMVEHVTQEMQLKAASLSQQVKNLSGGNQQKVVLAKWLLHDCQIYIFDEPTRGVDVGAKSEIYRLMEDLARRGAGIIMISSDMPEVLNMSDRILVVSRRPDRWGIARDEATQESILRLAVGEAGA